MLKPKKTKTANRRVNLGMRSGLQTNKRCSDEMLFVNGDTESQRSEKSARAQGGMTPNLAGMLREFF
jgi:hypothetical protein